MQIWDQIESLLQKYKSAGIADIYNHDLFNRIAITFHSTSIEGSTLTKEETQVLIESGTVAKGKPLDHNNMTKDHYDALVFACDQSKLKREITTEFIQEIGSRVMRSTGGVINQMGGSYDTSKGEIRKGTVTAGERIFPDYTKVPDLLQKFCSSLNTYNHQFKSNKDLLSLSFQAHFNLVDIHPFGDGNGRTSRILMNYIQAFHGLPLGVVHKDEKSEYIKALNESVKAESPEPIINFMAIEYSIFLDEQLSQYQNRNKGISFMF